MIAIIAPITRIAPAKIVNFFIFSNCSQFQFVLDQVLTIHVSLERVGLSIKYKRLRRRNINKGEKKEGRRYAGIVTRYARGTRTEISSNMADNPIKPGVSGTPHRYEKTCGAFIRRFE